MASVTFRLGNSNRILVPSVKLGDVPAVGLSAPDSFTWTLFNPAGTQIGTGSLTYVTGSDSDYEYVVPPSVLVGQEADTQGSLVIEFTKGESKGYLRDVAKFKVRKFGQ